MKKYTDINDTEGKLDYDYDSILDCVNNILGTQRGSLAMKRGFGINLEKYLFDPISPNMIPLIRGELIRSLKLNCPFLDIIKINITLNEYLETYEVEVLVNAKGLPDLITTFQKFKRIR